MSKRELKKYVTRLSKLQLEEQILELYEKFTAVKTYYDFVFNPKESQLIKESKLKITNEYFPIRGKKAKMRRSIAQKFIKQYILLGVDSFIIADIMLYNIEIMQAYTSEKEIKNESFYKSSLNSFNQAIDFIVSKSIYYEYKNRVEAIAIETEKQKWINYYAFIGKIEYLNC